MWSRMSDISYKPVWESIRKEVDKLLPKDTAVIRDDVTGSEVKIINIGANKVDNPTTTR